MYRTKSRRSISLLDLENDHGDGTPFLHTTEAYHTWAEVLSEGYEKLLDKVERGKRSVLDEYGATNHAEFFAVATECFIEKPRQMNKKHPELYQTLKEYYRFDPLQWS